MPAVSMQFKNFVPATSESQEARDAVKRFGRGLFARFLGKVHQAQTRRVEREIARLVEAKGRLTDTLERNTERRFI